MEHVDQSPTDELIEVLPNPEADNPPTGNTASLRGVVGPDLSYSICIVNDEDVNEDQTFTTDKALTFPTLEAAIGSLKTLLNHVEAAQINAACTAAYNNGFAAAGKQLAASSPGDTDGDNDEQLFVQDSLVENQREAE